MVPGPHASAMRLEAGLPPPQRRQKLAQTVVVDFVHQRQQTAQLVVRKALAGKPVQVVAGQVCQHTAFVLAIGHLHRHQALQRGRVQPRNVHAFSPLPA